MGEIVHAGVSALAQDIICGVEDRTGLSDMVHALERAVPKTVLGMKWRAKENGSDWYVSLRVPNGRVVGIEITNLCWPYQNVMVRVLSETVFRGNRHYDRADMIVIGSCVFEIVSDMMNYGVQRVCFGAAEVQVMQLITSLLGRMEKQLTANGYRACDWTVFRQ